MSYSKSCHGKEMSLKLESLGVKPFSEMHAFRAGKMAQWLELHATTTTKTTTATTATTTATTTMPEFHLWDPRSGRREKKEISS